MAKIAHFDDSNGPLITPGDAAKLDNPFAHPDICLRVVFPGIRQSNTFYIKARNHIKKDQFDRQNF